MRILGIAIALLLACPAATAETLPGRVVGISDGDTLTVLVEKRQVKVPSTACTRRSRSSARADVPITASIQVTGHHVIGASVLLGRRHFGALRHRERTTWMKAAA